MIEREGVHADPASFDVRVRTRQGSRDPFAVTQV